MRSIGVLEAKTNFSSLLDEVQSSGETVVITRHGRPVARLMPDDGCHPPRRRLSGPDLAERARRFREAQKPDPEFDRMSWEELKKIARE
ncbi:MAG: type II toxin-antitoxin system Phd/YefM family antitoxin [Brevundimonas sp.]|uniref:type II toxin-antitoxin system Phd/YefM family antitoxin n=1 Tax=Brevundimonas sp. TaxID=1871086 RepID=UPI0040339D4E